MEPVLQLDGLSKHFGRLTAVDNLTLAVEKGNIYGLLGPNGSGKTTTLGMALDVIRPTGGSFRWFGQPISYESKRRIGAILETPNFYNYLSGHANLTIVAEIKQVPLADVQRVLELTGLEKRKQDKFRTYSLGMKQRLALAAAMLGNPEVLVLDEPTNGLDPQGIAEVRELILRVAAQGTTIILASHLLDEVEKTCTHVAVMQNGKLRAAGPVQEILVAQDTVVVKAAAHEQALQVLRHLPQVEQLTDNGKNISLVLRNGFSSADLNSALFENGVVLSELTVRKKSLEAQFLEIIKQNNA